MTLGTIFILIASGSLLAVVIFYFGNFFLRSYLPPEITVTKNEIISSGGFMDPVTVEKLKVDSFGNEQRPIKYIITCSIKQKDGVPPVGLKEVKLNESGGYRWTEKNVQISISHPDGLSKELIHFKG